ncbi:MAG: DUF4405 domain-containing protein [Chloroflexi bacterium]|nr:DUF4405 domain-containing protein [Chloroflexota bacterium]
MSSSTSIKTKLIMNILVAGLTLALLSTALTGLALHEWLGIAIGVFIIVHMLLGWQWIAAISMRFFRNLPALTRITYILDFILFIAMTLAIYTGLMISRVAIPVLGLTGAAPNFLWRGLHSLSANSLLLLVGLHLAISWNWIVKTVQKYIIGPLQPQARQSAASAATEKE